MSSQPHCPSEKRCFSRSVRGYLLSAPETETGTTAKGVTWASVSASCFIAAGAVLAWAVDAEVSGVDITAVGIILLVVGIIGLLVSLVFWSSWGGFGGRDGGGGGQNTTIVERDSSS